MPKLVLPGVGNSSLNDVDSCPDFKLLSVCTALPFDADLIGDSKQAGAFQFCCLAPGTAWALAGPIRPTGTI